MSKFIIFLYSIFLISFSVYTYLYIDPGFLYLQIFFTGIAFSQRLLVVIGYCSFIVLLFTFYGYFLYKTKKTVSFSSIAQVIGITFLCLIFSYPTMVSHDIFNYMTTAKVTFFYGENPYMVMPVEFINESFLSYTRAANKYALYGPTWIGLTGIPYLLSFQNMLLQLFLFKILVGCFYILAVGVFYKLSKSKSLTVLFSLNPLVLVETLISGHNDIVMICFTLMSFYLVQKKKLFLAVVCILISIFIKYATVFLIPVFMYVVWKSFKQKDINWSFVWKVSFFSMLLVFLLSPIREELYPWYFLWVLPFALLWGRKMVTLISIVVSFGLLFYYIPYMFTGHYLLFAKYGLAVTAAIVFIISIYIFRRITKFYDT